MQKVPFRLWLPERQGAVGIGILLDWVTEKLVKGSGVNLKLSRLSQALVNLVTLTLDKP